MSTLNKDDEVIIPHHIGFPIRMVNAGGKAKIIETNMEENFKINAKQLNSNQ